MDYIKIHVPDNGAVIEIHQQYLNTVLPKNLILIILLITVAYFLCLTKNLLSATLLLLVQAQFMIPVHSLLCQSYTQQYRAVLSCWKTEF